MPQLAAGHVHQRHLIVHGRRGGGSGGRRTITRFQLVQQLPGPADHRIRQSGHFGNVYTEGVIGPAGDDFPQENHFILLLFHGDVVVFHALELLLHDGQLVVMGGKQGFCPQLFPVRCMFQNGPGNGHAVKGRGTPSDFIEYQQGAGGGVAENLRHLRHLHHKGGLARGQVIRRADTGEQPVHNANPGRFGRDKAAHLGHQDHQGHLTHIGGFTGHVGTSENGDIVAADAQGGVIGYKETALQHLLHHRMASVLDDDFTGQVHFGAAVVIVDGHMGQIGQYIGGGNGARRQPHPVSLSRQPLPDLVEQLIFQRGDAVLGREDGVFQLL